MRRDLSSQLQSDMCLSNELYYIKQKKKSLQYVFCRDEDVQSQLRTVERRVDLTVALCHE